MRQRDTEGDEAPAEDASDVRRLAHRPVPAAVLRPAHCPDDPAAVEWCSGQDVERRQHEVDGGEPGERDDDRSGSSHGVEAVCDRHREPADNGVAQWTGRGDEPFCPWRGRITVESGHPAETPELDRFGADPKPLGDECMGKLVDEDGDEEADDADGPDDSAEIDDESEAEQGGDH